MEPKRDQGPKVEAGKLTLPEDAYAREGLDFDGAQEKNQEI